MHMQGLYKGLTWFEDHFLSKILSLIKYPTLTFLASTSVKVILNKSSNFYHYFALQSSIV